MDDLLVSYRYALRMPNAQESLSVFKEKLFTHHAFKILEGKEQLLISPIFKKGSVELIQPIFDFDGRKASGVLKAYDEAQELTNKLNKYPFIYELTKDGVHVAFNIALYDIQDVKMFRTAIKKITASYSTLDIPATFKDLPIFRFGSYRENYTMSPVRDLNMKSFSEIVNKKPLDLYDRDMWLKLWKQFLFPKHTVSATSFLKRLSS